MADYFRSNGSPRIIMIMRVLIISRRNILEEHLFEGKYP
jgi:hypothetical protein